MVWKEMKQNLILIKIEQNKSLFVDFWRNPISNVKANETPSHMSFYTPFATCILFFFNIRL